jgi:hypothetical protein
VTVFPKSLQGPSDIMLEGGIPLSSLFGYDPIDGPAQLIEYDLDEAEPRDEYTGPMANVISVSQLKKFTVSKKGCPRAWALEKLARLPRQFSLPLRDGNRLHRAIRDWYWGLPGDEPWERKWRPEGPTGALALALMRHVAEPKEWESEPTWFLEIKELDTAIFIKPDLIRHDRTAFKDWKSTSATQKRSPWVLQSPKWWPGETMPGPDYFTLLNDIQGRVYAHGLMQRFDLSSISAEWVYGSKKFSEGQMPKTWTLLERFERNQTEDWCCQYVWPIIKTMNTLKSAYLKKQIDSVLLIPHNPFSCDHKGRFCDHLGHCNLTPSPIPLSALHLPVLPA